MTDSPQPNRWIPALIGDQVGEDREQLAQACLRSGGSEIERISAVFFSHYANAAHKAGETDCNTCGIPVGARTRPPPATALMPP